MDTSPPKHNDVIADTLGLTPIPNRPVAAVEAPQVEDDFEFARNNLLMTIKQAQEALDGIMSVAAMGQQARSYEVVATMIKTIADANKDLLELSKKKKELMKPEEGGRGPSTVNNNMFVGNTAELLAMIKKNNGV